MIFFGSDTLENKSASDENNYSIFIIVILCLVIFSAYNSGAISVLSNYISEHFNLNNTQLGYLMSAVQMGGFFALLIIGQLTEKFGPYIILRFSFIGLGIGYLICGINLSIVFFIMGQIIIGFFMAGLAISFPSFMVIVYPEYKRKGLSLSLVAFSISGLIAPVFIELVIGKWPQYIAKIIHLPYLFLAFFLLTGQFLLIKLPSAVKKGGIKEKRQFINYKLIKKIFSGKSLLIIILAVLHGIADVGIYLWLPKYLRSTFDILPIAPGFILFLYSLMYFFSRLVLTALPEKSFQRLFLIIPGALGGSIFLFSLWTQNPLIIGLGYPLAAFCWSVEYPVLISEAAEIFSEWFSTFFSSTLLSLRIATMLFISFIGFISENFGGIKLGLTISGAGFILFSIISIFTSLGKSEKNINVI